tara:strand:+ start:581 stop:2011 length:1431 start_codon:yes stop_codon:yes gene_type:complete
MTDNRPSLLNIKSMPVSTALQFTTDVLDAVIVGGGADGRTFSRFELQPKGFLHPNTQLVVKLKASGTAGVADSSFPFIGNGLYSLIRRAVLKTADGTTICETDDLNELLACKSQFISNSANKEREQYKTGRQMAYEQIFTDGDGQVAGGYGLSNHRDYDIRAGGGITTGFVRQGLSVEQHLLNEKESSFSLSLHDLFPYLKSGNQLPLFMMPRVQVEIYWSDLVSNARMCSQTDADAADPNTTFPVISQQIYADYLFYGSDFMADYQQKNNDLSFSYIDYRLSKNTVTATTLGTALVRNVGGNGMQVTKCFAQFSPPDTIGLSKNLLGKYTALGPMPDGLDGGRLNLTSNLFYNNEFLYPQAVVNSATHYHHLISTEGAAAYVSREAYSGEGDTIVALGTHHFMTKSQRTNLQVKNFWQGFKIIDGQRLDSRGIDLHTQYIADDGSGTATDTVQRVWLEILRFARLEDGKLNTFYS